MKHLYIYVDKTQHLRYNIIKLRDREKRREKMKDMRKEREQRKKAILSKIKEYEMINISFESDEYKLDQFNKLVGLVDCSNSIDEIAVAIYMMAEDEDCTLEYIKERLAE